MCRHSEEVGWVETGACRTLRFADSGEYEPVRGFSRRQIWSINSPSPKKIFAFKPPLPENQLPRTPTKHAPNCNSTTVKRTKMTALLDFPVEIMAKIFTEMQVEDAWSDRA